MFLSSETAVRLLHALPSKKLSACGSVSALALAAAMLMPATAAQAACSDNMPAAGVTITCDATLPNPDTVGVQQVGGVASDNVTVNMLSGAQISVGGGENGIDLGTGSTITMASGSSITAGGAGIRLSGLDAGSPALFNIDGTISALIGVEGFSHGRVNLGQTGAITSGREALFSFTDGGRFDIDGTLTRTDGVADTSSIYSVLGHQADNVEINVGSTGVIQSSATGIVGILSLGSNNTINVSGDILIDGQNSAVVFAPGISIVAGIATNGGTYNVININDGGYVRTTAQDTIGIAAYTSVNNFSNHTVNIAAGGAVEVSGADAVGIAFGNIYDFNIPGAPDRLSGFINNLNNAGMIISADGAAVGVASGELSLVNSGTIRGYFGVSSYAGDGDPLSIVNSGTITSTGDVGSMDNYAIQRVDGVSDDRLELQPGSVINGLVDLGEGVDTLVFGGNSGSATFDGNLLFVAGLNDATAQYFGIDRFEKRGGSTWTFTGGANMGDTKQLDIFGGRVIFNALGRPININAKSGTVLSGTGTTGNLVIESGGILAPGASIGTMSTSNLTLSSGSNFQVEVNDAGMSDRIIVAGTVTLGGGTLSVFDTAGGAFAGADPFNYTIIDNDGADAVSGTFGTVTNQLAFLTPTVSYVGGDGNDVRLTLTRNDLMPPIDSCIISGRLITCSGNQSSGIVVTDADQVDMLLVRALTTDIAPGLDVDGIVFNRASDAGPIGISAEADDNKIDLLGNADGIFALTNGSEIIINNALDITGVTTNRTGESMSGIRIRSDDVVASGLRNMTVNNSGDINIDGNAAGDKRFTLSAIDVEYVGGTDTRITNSGVLTVKGDVNGNISSRDGASRSDDRVSAAIAVRQGIGFGGAINPRDNSSVTSIINDGELFLFGADGITARVAGDVEIINRGKINLLGQQSLAGSGIVLDVDANNVDRIFASMVKLENFGDIVTNSSAGNGIGIEVEAFADNYIIRNEGNISLNAAGFRGRGIAVNAGLNNINTKTVGHLARLIHDACWMSPRSGFPGLAAGF